MEILVLFIVFVSLYYVVTKSKTPNSFSGPNVSVGNGIESHYDFLEMHGFMTAEEREEQRRFEQEYKDHPERFESYTLEQIRRLITPADGNEK